MDRDIEAIVIHCLREGLRQHVGVAQIGSLLHGYDYALENATRLPTEGDFLHLAGIIEPSNGGRYRQTPVTFANGGSSCAPGQIAQTMGRLFGFLDAETDAEEFTKAVLQVHPFSDGNGRTGFILRNWLNGTLVTPEPLPYYFGEKEQERGMGL